MQRQLRLLVAVLCLAITAGSCSRDFRSVLAPDAVQPPDSLGRLVYSSANAPLNTPAWSGHTDAIYFIEQEKGLRELNLESGVVRTLDDVGAHLVMAPNGRALYYRDRLPGGAGRLLKRFDLVTGAIAVVSDTVSYSPVPSNGDGLVAYTRPGDYALKVAVPLESGDEVVAPRGFPIAFSPDDREILYSKSHFLHPILNPDPLQVRDLVSGLVREVSIDVHGAPFGQPFWSERGITIPSRDQDGRLWIRRGDLVREVFASAEQFDASSLSWAPGGSRLAFLTHGYTRRGRILTAWVIELETSRLFRVAHGLDQPPPRVDPGGMPAVSYGEATAFSPDGRSLVYTSAGRVFIASID